MVRFDLKALQDLVSRGISREGLRPFSRRISVPVGVLRSIKDGRDISVSNLLLVSEKLEMEFYLGPKRVGQPVDLSHPSPGEVKLDDDEYKLVDRFEINVSAGDALLLPVVDDNMEPDLYVDDLVLVDRRKNKITTNRTYGFTDLDGTIRIRRLGIIPDSQVILASNNSKYPPVIYSGKKLRSILDGIIGEVVWSGHSWV